MYFLNWVARIGLGAGVVCLIAQASYAQIVGMVVDHETDSVTVFDADTDTVLGTVSIGVGIFVGDCNITGDQSLGFATDFTRRLWLIDLTTDPPVLAAGPNPIPVSSNGEDTAITPDQQFILVCDGLSQQPISVVDIAGQMEVSTLAVSPDCNSVDVCGNNSVLVTSHTWGTVHRLTIDATGNLTDTGEVLGGINSPSNVFCAPGGRSGLVLNRIAAVMRSFTIPGLGPVDTRSLAESLGISGVVTPDGNRVIVRSQFGTLGPVGFVEAFDYDSDTGVVGAAPLYAIPVTSTFSLFGVDQIAIHPNGQKLYVSQPSALNVYDAQTGDLLSSITDPNIVQPTGVCFPAAFCGNGMRELLEECDGIDDSACPGACLSNCTCGPICGDDLVNQPDEECDGVDDSACPGLCQSDCTCGPFCGDNLANQASEECDGTDDSACPGLCQSDCTCGPFCGDNLVNQASEECDGTDDSACPTLCRANCTCQVNIPTISGWGLAVITLFLLTGAKVFFARREPHA